MTVLILSHLAHVSCAAILDVTSDIVSNGGRFRQLIMEAFNTNRIAIPKLGFRTFRMPADRRQHPHRQRPLARWAQHEDPCTRRCFRAPADAKGRLMAIVLTGGEAHDCPVAERLIRRVKPSKHMLGDKAYDSAELRIQLHRCRTKPVIPNRSNRKQPFRFSKRLIREHHRIENAISRLKDFRRIATRYDRLARNFLASVCLAATFVWWI